MLLKGLATPISSLQQRCRALACGHGKAAAAAAMDTSSDSSEWLDSDSDWEPELEGAACKPAAAAAAAAAGGSKAGGVELRAVFGCSRRQPEKESRQPSHKNPVASKKAGCLFELRVEVENGIAEVTERHGHNGHTPGNSEDVRWLPPCAAVVAKIEEVRG